MSLLNVAIIKERYISLCTYTFKNVWKNENSRKNGKISSAACGMNKEKYHSIIVSNSWRKFNFLIIAFLFYFRANTHLYIAPFLTMLIYIETKMTNMPTQFQLMPLIMEERWSNKTSDSTLHPFFKKFPQPIRASFFYLLFNFCITTFYYTTTYHNCFVWC